MVHLTLAGVSDDGKRLLLVSDAGVEFTLDIDARLRAALRGDTARLGQLEIQMDSALRPRDIQARIRAGETPEAVAQAAQTSVDKIMAFAAPVLAERQHIADRAQRSSVRRRNGGDQAAGGARTLGDVVAGHLRSINVDPEHGRVGRLAARGRPLGADRASSARPSAAGTPSSPSTPRATTSPPRTTTPAGCSARSSPRPRAPEPRNDLEQARQRRLSAVHPGRPEELPLGDDAIELVTDADRDPASPEPGRRAAAGGVPHRGAAAGRRARAARGGGGRRRPRHGTDERCRPRRSRRRRRPREPDAGRRRSTRPAPGAQEPRAGVGAELGRDHVRRRQVGVTRSGPGPV